MSFHASSCLIQVNLLHAEVSYIIDIACHWVFFQYYKVYLLLGLPKRQIFFIFQLPIFAEPYPLNLCSPMSRLDYWAKTRYQPILRHCLGAVLQYLAIFCTESWNRGWKLRKFQQSQRCFGSRKWETMLVKCACGLHNCIMTSWIFNELKDRELHEGFLALNSRKR